MAQEVEEASGDRGGGSDYHDSSEWGRVEYALRRRWWWWGEGASTYLGGSLGAGEQFRRVVIHVERLCGPT